MSTPPLQRPGRPPSSPPPFLDGILAQLRAFAAASGVAPDRVAVRLTLVDGSAMSMNGLQSSSAVASGWGMIEGLGLDESEAVVLRESALFKVEFALRTPVRPKPIGFEAEIDVA